MASTINRDILLKTMSTLKSKSCWYGQRFLLAVCVLFGMSAAVFGSTLTFDPSASLSSNVGGSGYWNTSNTNWYNGTTDVMWDSSTTNTNIAGFQVNTTTSSYTVTVSGTVYTGGFATVGTGTSSYTLTGSGAIVLNGTSPTITVASNGSVIDTYIDIQGTNGFTKTGGGILRINKSISCTGTVLVAAGNLNLAVNQGLSSGTDLSLGSSSAFFLQGYNQTINSLTGSGAIRISGTGRTSVLTISGTSNTTFSGSIYEQSTNKIALVLTNSGRLTLTNGTNVTSYNGGTTVGGGATLALGKSLTGTGSITLTNGTLSGLTSSITLGGSVAVNSGAKLEVRDSLYSSAVTMTLANASTLTLNGGEIDFTLGTSSDSIVGSGGAFTLTSGTIALTLGSGFSYDSSYNLLTGFASTSTYSAANLDVTGISDQYDAVWNFNSTTGTLTLSFTSVPEPSTYALLISGVLMQLVVLRFSRKRRAEMPV